MGEADSRHARQGRGAPPGPVPLNHVNTDLKSCTTHLRWAKLILDTLAKAAAPLIGLCLSGLVILLAFAHVGLVAFGSQVRPSTLNRKVEAIL